MNWIEKLNCFKYQTLQQEVQSLHSDLHHSVFNRLNSVTGPFPFSMSKTFRWTRTCITVQSSADDMKRRSWVKDLQLFLINFKPSWIVVRSRNSTAVRAIKQSASHTDRTMTSMSIQEHHIHSLQKPSFFSNLHILHLNGLNPSTRAFWACLGAAHMYSISLNYSLCLLCQTTKLNKQNLKASRGQTIT